MITIDHEFALNLRDELVATAQGTSALARHVRRVRIGVGIAVGLGTAALLTGGALAVAASIPGDHVVSSLGVLVSGTYTGSATVELGPRPDGANAVKFTLQCLSEGTLSYSYIDVRGIQNGGSMKCVEGADAATLVELQAAPVGNKMKVRDMPLADGSTSFEIVGDAGVRWTIVAQYMKSITTDWGINANGQTYGTPNEYGEPDLEAVLATNGENGYAYTKDFFPTPEPTPPYFIPVYESDGVTVIGEFKFGND
jgi:hypothetical protein